MGLPRRDSDSRTLSGWRGRSLGPPPARFPCHGARLPLVAATLGLLSSLSVSGASNPAPEEVALRIGRLGLTDALLGAVFQESGDERIGWFDENGDGVRDEVDDVYFFDHEADGSPDRAVDWTDLDGDGRADRQLIAYVTPGALGVELSAYVIEDRSADSGFWYTVGGEYIQDLSQFRSDFSGDTFFAALRWDDRSSSWVGFDENPFCFYDPDGDGRSEEALRVSGLALAAHSFRWSFDTDDDGAGPMADPAMASDESSEVTASPGAAESSEVTVSTASPGAAESPESTGATELAPEPYAHAYDYDLSLTGIVRSSAYGDAVAEVELRPGVSVRLLRWEQAREWALKQNWYRVLLTFDENDRNVDPGDPLARGRWEGVIASAPDGFPQIGNPACGRFMKRYEERSGIPGGPELYFHPLDGRVHLRGASLGWIDLDRDGNGIADGRLETTDRDGDGVIDTWFWDGDGDGSFDSAYRATGDVEVEPVGMDFLSLHAIESRVRERCGLAQGERFAAEIEAWTQAGRFVPIDSLATWRGSGR